MRTIIGKGGRSVKLPFVKIIISNYWHIYFLLFLIFLLRQELCGLSQ